MTHDEMIAVIQAHKDGKQLQWRENDGSTEWTDCPSAPHFDFYHFDFRIKPAEKKLVPHWPAVCRNNDSSKLYWLSDRLYPSVEEAQRGVCAEVIRLATEYPPIMLEIQE